MEFLFNRTHVPTTMEMMLGEYTSPDGGWNASEAPVEPAHPDRFTFAERIVLAVAMSAIAVVGTAGNGLVILSVALSRKLRTATNVYVVSLSATDLLTCLCLPWQALGTVSVDGWPIAPWICSVAGGLSITFVGCSVITLAFIAVNRLYLITTSSDRYHRLYTLKMLIVTTLVAWLLPAATVVIPPLCGIGKLGYDEKYLRCGPLQGDADTTPYDVIVASVLYPIPMVTIVVSYVKIFRYLRRHTKTIMAPSEHSSGSSYPKSPTAKNGSSFNFPSPSNQPPQGSSITKKRLSKRQIEITKNLFYVVCAFVLCLTPYSVGIFIPGAEHLLPYAGVILLLNSCVNPAIYAAKHPYFRTIFRSILTCHFSKIPEPAHFLRYALSARADSSK